MKPSVAWLPAGLDGCALYRMFFSHLRMEGSIFLFQPQTMDLNFFRDRNIVVVQRLSSQQNYEAMKLFKKLNLKIVYDLDDDLWSVPSYNPAFKLMKKWLPGFEICAKMSDFITVSTEHLRVMVKKALGRACPNIEVVENAIDYDWFIPISERYKKQKEGKVVVGWAGTDTHTGDVDRVFSLIPELLSAYPEMDFEVVGQQVPENLLAFGNRVHQKSFVPVAEFAANWAGWQWDISLAPVAENEFNRSKSNIKMLEAASIKIPCVASRFGEYAKFAQHSKMLRTAVQADGSKEWKDKIGALITNKSYRTEVGLEMHKVAKEKYNVLHRVTRWNELFQGLVG